MKINFQKLVWLLVFISREQKYDTIRIKEYLESSRIHYDYSISFYTNIHSIKEPHEMNHHMKLIG